MSINDLYIRVSRKLSKTDASSKILTSKFYSGDGKEIKDVRIAVPSVEVQGIIMPFVDKTRGDKKYDMGVPVPAIKMFCEKDTEQFNLVQAFLDKLNDAHIAFAYSLDQIDLTKFIKRIEAVKVEGKELFTPRIHYNDGSVLDVKKNHVKEVGSAFLPYFTVSMESDNVFFRADAPKLFRHYGKKEGGMYPLIELDCAGSFTMRRKKEMPATEDQLDIEKWGLKVFETKKEDDKWVRGSENIVNRLPTINAPGEKAGFVAYVNLYHSYTGLAGEGKSAFHFGGSVFYISSLGTNNEDQMPVGNFVSSLPVIAKKLTAGKKASPKKESDEEDGYADEE